MRRSTNSETLFNQFSSNYQKISLLHATQEPFVYVDTNGNIKLLTSVVDSEFGDDGIFAVSMAQDGWMEFLALSES